MGDESVPFLLDQGTTKTYQIPIAHLDYKFIEKCTDVKHLEKILRVLRYALYFLNFIANYILVLCKTKEPNLNTPFVLNLFMTF